VLFDKIGNIGQYKGLSKGLDTALAFLENEVQNMDETKVYELENGIKAHCAVYTPVPVNKGTVEAHRKYIDVMFMKDGNEQIGYKNVDTLENIICKYDEATDVLLAKEQNITLLPFLTGSIAVWFPQDAHMPGVSDSASGTVKRVIIKVPVESGTI